MYRSFFLVPREGLEPSRYRYHACLRRDRLPISTPRQLSLFYYNINPLKVKLIWYLWEFCDLFVIINNMEKDKKTTEAYNKIASEYNKRNYQSFWIKEYSYFKELISGDKVVDLGCGAGRDAEQFVKDAFDYLGVDSSEKMLDLAKERVPEAQFRLLDLRDLDLPVSSFDGFWASASLLHFPKVEIPTILKSFYNLLKTGGVGFISVKAKQAVSEGFIKEDKAGGIERYFSFFTEDELTKFLEEARFKIVKLSHLFEDDPLQTEWLCFFVKK